MQGNTIQRIRQEESLVGKIGLYSDNVLRQYNNPNISWTKEMVVSESEALDRVSNGIKYPRVVFENQVVGADPEAVIYAVTKEVCSKYIVTAVVSEKESKIANYIKGGVMTLLALTQRNISKIKFVSSEEEAIIWIKKMMNFPYIDELKKLKERDFKILNLWLHEYSTVEIADEIQMSMKTVDRELKRLWGILGTDKRIYVKEIFEYSEATGGIAVPYKHITRDELIEIYNSKKAK